MVKAPKQKGYPIHQSKTCLEHRSGRPFTFYFFNFFFVRIRIKAAVGVLLQASNYLGRDGTYFLALFSSHQGQYNSRMNWARPPSEGLLQRPQ